MMQKKKIKKNRQVENTFLGVRAAEEEKPNLPVTGSRKNGLSIAKGIACALRTDDGAFDFHGILSNHKKIMN